MCRYVCISIYIYILYICNVIFHGIFLKGLVSWILSGKSHAKVQSWDPRLRETVVGRWCSMTHPNSGQARRLCQGAQVCYAFFVPGYAQDIDMMFPMLILDMLETSGKILNDYMIICPHTKIEGTFLTSLAQKLHAKHDHLGTKRPRSGVLVCMLCLGSLVCMTYEQKMTIVNLM